MQLDTATATTPINLQFIQQLQLASARERCDIPRDRSDRWTWLYIDEYDEYIKKLWIAGYSVFSIATHSANDDRVIYQTFIEYRIKHHIDPRNILQSSIKKKIRKLIRAGKSLDHCMKLFNLPRIQTKKLAA